MDKSARRGTWRTLLPTLRGAQGGAGFPAVTVAWGPREKPQERGFFEVDH